MPNSDLKHVNCGRSEPFVCLNTSLESIPNYKRCFWMNDANLNFDTDPITLSHADASYARDGQLAMRSRSPQWADHGTEKAVSTKRCVRTCSAAEHKIELINHDCAVYMRTCQSVLPNTHAQTHTRTERSRTEQNKTEQKGAERNRAERNKTKHSGTKRNTT